jgi:hypothetical protein
LVYFVAMLYISLPFGIFFGNWVYFWAIWYIFPVLVCCTKKHLATLIGPQLHNYSRRSPENLAAIRSWPTMMDFGNEAGLPDGPVYFQTKNPSLGKFLEGLGSRKRMIYSMAIWNILRPFGIFYGHLVI